jgi:hypothetical protein
MKRTLWILIGILAALGIATFLVLRQPGEVSTTDTSGRVLVTYDSAAVDKIEVYSPGTSVTLEREAGRWMLISPVKYQADEATVALAIGTGRKIEITSLVSTNPEKRKLFQVDSSGTLVRVYERGVLKTARRSAVRQRNGGTRPSSRRMKPQSNPFASSTETQHSLSRFRIAPGKSGRTQR